MNAIGYIRVSTDQQADKFGPDAQKEAIYTYADEHDYEIVDWVEDHISGVKDDRPGFNEILAMKNTPHKIDAVIAFKTDRIARDAMLYCYYHYSLEKKGITLISATEDLDTYGDFAPVMLSVAAYIGRKERENIQIRTNAGKAQKAAGGGFTGGKVPYGYDTVDRQLVINEKEAEMVRMLFRLYDSGMPQAEVTRLINEAGYRSRKGQEFLPQQIYSIRKNRKLYEGMFRTRKGEWVEGQQEAIIERSGDNGSEDEICR